LFFSRYPRFSEISARREMRISDFAESRRGAIDNGKLQTNPGLT